jgi:ribonuclease T
MTGVGIPQNSWVSIDVETAGPDPGSYALLSIGACLVTQPEVGFYIELVPDQKATEPAAMAVHGLTMRHLRAKGTDPATAMEALAEWLAGHVDGQAIMVGFNAPFDWMFISQYFWYYLGRNPLGHTVIDIKALAMGWLRVPWQQTSFPALAERCGLPTSLSHNALEDARQQAQLLCALVTSTPHTPVVSTSRGRQRNGAGKKG